MAGKHTPGPWRAIAQTNAAWEIAGPERKGYAEGLVCRVTLNEANARLIAAAPELLSALIHANNETKLYDGHPGIYADLIARATQPLPPPN